MRDPFSTFREWLHRKPHNGDIHAAVISTAPAPTPPELPWIKQLARAGLPVHMNYPDMPLGRLVDQAADRYPDNPAIYYKSRTWTYGELAGWINRVAGGLASLGVNPGDRVLLALPNCPEFVAIFFALQKLAAIPVNAGPLLGRDDLEFLIRLTKPAVVIGLDLQAARLASAAAETSVQHFVHVSLEGYQDVLHWTGYQLKLWQRPSRALGAAHETTLEALTESAPPRPPTLRPDPDATALLQPTSGTTGTIKLAQLSHRNLLANAAQISVCTADRAAQECVLAVLPMFHAYGLMVGVLAPVLGVAAMIVETRFVPDDCLDDLLRHRPSIFPLVPAICHALCNEIERRGRPCDLSGHLRICTSGAAPLPADVGERFARLTGVPVIEGYGLTEASPVTHANLFGRPRSGSIGLPLPDTSVRVADLNDDARDAGPGEAGELFVAGPQVASGYYNNPEATAAMFFHDDAGRRWLRTGDIVTVDEDGFFKVVDRRKDMINRAGFKVYPAKCEHVLAMHPQVAEAAVVGIAGALKAHPGDEAATTRGEQVVAAIVVKSPGVDRAALTRELQSLCGEHLAAYEIPTRFVFVSQLPKSALGKVLKKEMRITLAGEASGRPAILAEPDERDAAVIDRPAPPQVRPRVPLSDVPLPMPPSLTP